MGTVYLVGAGPGDPGLIPLRGAELLGRAGVVVADGPLPGRLAGLLPSGAEVRVLAAPAPHEVAALLQTAASGHDTVVRLLPGDPLRSSRGRQEAHALAALSVPLEVVPAPDDAAASAAYAGIAVEGGQVGSAVVVHEGDTAAAAEAWARTVARGGTVAIRVGGAGLDAFADALLRAGLDPETPAAAIESGTTPRQRTLTSPLLDLATAAERAGLRGGLVLVVGDGVRARSELAWLERRPLLGLRVVVTRPADQTAGLSRLLEERGAIPIECPMIRIAPPADPEPIRRAAREAHGYDWVVFTSANGVERFWEELVAAGRDARALGGTRLACIGPATAAALATHGLTADLVPERYVAESLVSALAEERTVEGLRILIPRAAVAREVLPDELRERGASVDVVEAYRSLPDEQGAARLRIALEEGVADVVTFTASSTVDAFVEAVGADLRGAAAACIGPITAETARGHGLEVAVAAEEHTVEGLVAALVGWAESERRVGIRSS